MGGASEGCGPAQSPPRCTKCNSPPINSQCTNFIRLAVWLSGNALALINVVALRQTRLVPGWVTVCGTGKPSRYVTSQLSLLSSTNLPSWGEGGAVTSVGWQINTV